MKITYLGKEYDLMFYKEAKEFFKDHYEPILWESDEIVRIVLNRNPYKGQLIRKSLIKDLVP